MEDSLEDEFTPDSVENYKSRFPVSPKIDSEPETLLDDSQPSSNHLSGSRINLDEPFRDVEGSHSHNDVPVYQSQSIILSDNVTDQSHCKLTPIGNDHHFSSCSEYGNSPQNHNTPPDSTTSKQPTEANCNESKSYSTVKESQPQFQSKVSHNPRSTVHTDKPLSSSMRIKPLQQIQNFPREFESHNSIRHVSGHCESHKENTSNPPNPSCPANSQYCLDNAGCRGGLLQDPHGTHVCPPCINIHNSSDVGTPKHQEPVQRDDTDLILPVKRGILQLKTRCSSGQAKEKTRNTVGLPGKANTHPKVNSNCSDESLDEHSQFVTSTVPSTSILRNQDPKQHQAYVDNLKLSDDTDYQKHQETVQPNDNSPAVGTPKHPTPVRRNDTQLILPAKRGRLQLKTIGSSGQAKEQSCNAVKLHGKDIAPPKFHSGCSEESPDQAFKSFSPSVPSTSILHNQDTKQHQAFVHNLKLLDFRAQKAQETVQFNDTNLHSAAQRGTSQSRARGSSIQPNETSHHTVASLGKSDAHSQMVSPIKITEENFKCLSPSISSTLIIHTQDAKLCQQNACNNTLPDPHASKSPTSVQANDAHLAVKQGSSQLQTRCSTVQANELSPNTVGLVGLLCKSYADSYIDPICSSKTADDSIKLSRPSVPVTFLPPTQNTKHQQPHSNSLPIVSSAMRVPKSASLPPKENRKSHTNYNNSHSTGLAQSTESTHCDTSNLTVCVDSSNVEVHPPYCYTGKKISEVIGKSLKDRIASTAVSSEPTGRLLVDPDLEVDDGSTNIQTANCSIAQQAGHSNEEREFSEEGIKSYNDSVSEDLAKEQRKLTFCPEVAIGKEFYSDAEIKAYIADIKRTTGENFSIRDSKKKENRVKTHSRLHANPNLTFDLIIYVCIHGEITKESQSTNARQAFSQKLHCPAKIYFKLSDCGQFMKINEFTPHQNHDHLNGIPRAYLPQNRRPTPQQRKIIEDCIKIDGNKLKVLAQLESQGKNVLNRDYSNIKYQSQCVSDEDESIEDIIKVLEENDAIYEVKTNDANEFQGLLWVDRYMKHNAKGWCEHLQMDFTYNNVRPKYPLGTVLNVDGNGQTEYVGMCLLANESEELIDWFMSRLVTIIPELQTANKSWMTDKSKQIRNVLAKYFPTSDLYLCLYHVSVVFKKQIHHNHYPILFQNDDLTRTLLKHLEAMLYSSNEIEYQLHYEQFCQVAPPAIALYYNENWHGCRHQWVRSNMINANFRNSTNNRTEANNYQIKKDTGLNRTVVQFLKLFFLHQRQRCKERNARAVDHASKLPSNQKDPDLLLYYKLLTRYAYMYVRKQMGMMDHAKVTSINNEYVVLSLVNALPKYKVTLQECSCSAFKSMQLPCTHWFKLRSSLNLPLYEESVCAKRWTQRYLLEWHRVFSKTFNAPDCESTYQAKQVTENLEADVSICTESAPLPTSDHQVDLNLHPRGKQQDPRPTRQDSKSSDDVPKQYTKVKFISQSKPKGRPKHQLTAIGLPRGLPRNEKSANSLTHLPHHRATQKKAVSKKKATVAGPPPPSATVVRATDVQNLFQPMEFQSSLFNLSAPEVQQEMELDRPQVPPKRIRKQLRLSDFDYDFADESTLNDVSVKRIHQDIAQKPVANVLPFHAKTLPSKFALIAQWITCDGVLHVPLDLQTLTLDEIKFKDVFDYNIYSQEIDTSILSRYLDYDAYTTFCDIYNKYKGTVPDSCKKCLSTEDTDDWVRCDSCLSWLHQVCANLSHLPSNTEPFYCFYCETSSSEC